MKQAGAIKVLVNTILRPDIRVSGPEDDARRCKTMLSKNVIGRALVKLIGASYLMPDDWEMNSTPESPCLGDVGPHPLIGMLSLRVASIYNPVVYFISRLAEENHNGCVAKPKPNPYPNLSLNRNPDLRMMI